MAQARALLRRGGEQWQRDAGPRGSKAVLALHEDAELGTLQGSLKAHHSSFLPAWPSWCLRKAIFFQHLCIPIEVRE